MKWTASEGMAGVKVMAAIALVVAGVALLLITSRIPVMFEAGSFLAVVLLEAVSIGMVVAGLSLGVAALIRRR